MATRSSCVIIGAGAAGIAAACKLLENGINDIQILEAENRIGGRIHTEKFGNEGVVDLGAQWVHGEKGNVVSAMAQPLGLLGNTITDRLNMPFVNTSGQELSLDATQKIISLLVNIMKHSKSNLKIFEGSLGEYCHKEFRNKLAMDNLSTEEVDCAKHVMTWFEKFQTSYDGSDSWFYTSGRGQTEYWECEGNIRQAWKSGGFYSVFDLLTKKYLEPQNQLLIESKLQLNKEVICIEWDLKNCDKVIVTCQDKSCYIADHVIITVCLGVLKNRASTLFLPCLPAKKQTAINGLSIGTVDKIFLRFPHQWWPKEKRGFNFVWTDSDLQSFYRNYETDSCRNWLPNVYGFYMVDLQPNVLCGWVVGPSARTMELLSDNEVISSCMELLNKFLGYNLKIPQPIEMIRSTWSLNPHFKGVYSFRSMDTEAMNTGAAQLAEPLINSNGKTTVLFAGEATHDHFFSTVHGAIETGWREAERVTFLQSTSSKL